MCSCPFFNSSTTGDALSLAKKAKELGLNVQLQADASVMRAALQACLTEAVAIGVTEVLLLSATRSRSQVVLHS